MPQSRKHRPKKVTQAMIARESGVSQTLVSLVLSNASTPERVAEESRRRILETAQRLGYVLRGSAPRRKTLALILPVVSRAEQLESSLYASLDDFYARTQAYLAEAAYRKGYSLIVRPYEQPTEVAHWLTEWNVDGVLWNASDDKLLGWIAERYPTAQLHYPNSLLPVDMATANQEEIPILATDYLFKRGHRRICFIPGVHWGRVTALRAAFFREHAAELGLPLYEQFLREYETDTSGDIVSICLDLLKLPVDQRPTAFVAGDVIALNLGRKIQEAGFSVPDDVSLVGIDNLSAGAMSHPALTSIDVCQREVSEATVGMLVKRIAEPDLRYQKVFISPSIVERDSVADLTRKRHTANKTA